MVAIPPTLVTDIPTPAAMFGVRSQVKVAVDVFPKTVALSDVNIPPLTCKSWVVISLAFIILMFVRGDVIDVITERLSTLILVALIRVGTEMLFGIVALYTVAVAAP